MELEAPVCDEELNVVLPRIHAREGLVTILLPLCPALPPSLL